MKQEAARGPEQASTLWVKDKSLAVLGFELMPSRPQAIALPTELFQLLYTNLKLSSYQVVEAYRFVRC
jgi:hypothetical protein